LNFSTIQNYLCKIDKNCSSISFTNLEINHDFFYENLQFMRFDRDIISQCHGQRINARQNKVTQNDRAFQALSEYRITFQEHISIEIHKI